MASGSAKSMASRDMRGCPGVQASDALFRSLEVLELDGLPEAEARKLVGIDKP